MRMRILMCCENYFPSVGGVQEVIRQIATRLAARGHSVTVATSEHPQRPRAAIIDKVRVVSFGVLGNLATIMRGDISGYRNFVLNGNFDAVLIKAAQQWSFDALTPLLDHIPARKVFIPCGFSGLGKRTYDAYFAQMGTWLGAFDALIFYSDTFQDIRFARQCGLTNINVISNGADEREFATLDDGGFRNELDVPESSFLLLSVGSLIPAKGHWEAVRAFGLASLHRPATLVINCHQPPGSGIARLKRCASQGIQGRLPLSWIVKSFNSRHRGKKRIILADMSRADVVRAFKAADLFVFASRFEYSPLVLFESVAAGTPFLSAPAGNAQEIAAWTGGGRVYPADVAGDGYLSVDPNVLARHLEQMIADEGGRRGMAEAGRDAFLNGGFSWAKIAERYEAILAPG